MHKSLQLIFLCIGMTLLAACGGGGGGGGGEGIQAPAISVQPADRQVFAGNNTTFSVVASGSGLSYQWQVDTGTGFTNITDSAAYSGTSTNTLTLLSVNTGKNGYKYRVIVTGTAAPAVTSAQAALLVTAPTHAVIKLATSGNITLVIDPVLGTLAKIGGIQTAMSYPINKGLSIAESNVVTSGVAGGVQLVPNVTAVGKVSLGNFTLSTGFPVGEFATITFAIASGYYPLTSDFAILTGSTIIASDFITDISSQVSVTIQSVTFQ